MTRLFTKKGNTLFKVLTSLAIVALMSVSMVLPALADDPPYVGPIGESSKKPAPSAITKIFEMAVGTTTPNATFEFIFTPYSYDGTLYNDTTKEPEMPGIGPVEIKYSALTDSEAIILADGDSRILIKESEDLTAKIEWPDVGIYTYIVHELEDGVTLVGLPEKTGADYSKAVYTIEFWVDVDSEGEYFVKYVNAKISKTLTEIDVFYPGEAAGEKVDPTPDKWDKVPIEDIDIETHFSGIIFTNTYRKSDGGGTTDPDKTALQLTKKVVGLGSNTLRDVYFNFEVTVSQPSVVTEAQTYKAYVLGADGEVVKTNSNGQTVDSEGYFEIDAGTPFTVKLKHDEKLMFVDLHVGAKVEVEEQLNGDDRFIPSYTHNFDGKISENFDGKTAGIDWGFPREPGDKGPHYIPELNGTKVDYTNTRTNATPTGLDVNDLPYIVLIGLAAAGLAAFVVMKSRKRTEEDV